MRLEELVFRNEIVREALGAGEIDRLLATVDRRLEDASLESLHPETRMEQAYHAILGCAVIGLRVHGLRTVDRPGHHVVALESLADTVGATAPQLTSLRARQRAPLATPRVSPRTGSPARGSSTGDARGSGAPQRWPGDPARCVCRRPSRPSYR